MRRKSKSQWEFDDLFAEPTPDTPDTSNAPTAPSPAKKRERKPDRPPDPQPTSRSVNPIKPPAPVTPVTAAARPPATVDPDPLSGSAERKILSVTQLTGTVKRLLRNEIGQIWVSGEVTNLRIQNSGHVYFSIKDAGAQLSCVLFRGDARKQRDLLEEGRSVVLFGEITVYEPRGQYQMRVIQVELLGVGALQQAFERLKAKLQAEGLFDRDRKRALPRYPQRIGLVTSPTGAAIRDVVHVIQRRQPGLEIILAPVRVQGAEAGPEIASAIRDLNAWSRSVIAADPSSGAGLDLILVTRGGGSLEDLWAFNEEIVARAVFESELPVVSAVGHEIDFTISDFVADLRAATPSAAAEIVTEDAWTARQVLADSLDAMRYRMGHRLQRLGAEIVHLNQRMDRVHPRRWLDERWQHLDDLQNGLARSVKRRQREFQNRRADLYQRWLRARPYGWLRRQSERMTSADRRLRRQSSSRLNLLKTRLATLTARLQLLSPLEVLARGYSITTDEATGKVVRDAAGVKTGQTVATRVKSGSFRSVVAGRTEDPG